MGRCRGIEFSAAATIGLPLRVHIDTSLAVVDDDSMLLLGLFPYSRVPATCG
jgi:hypothetical protein